MELWIKVEVPEQGAPNTLLAALPAGSSVWTTPELGRALRSSNRPPELDTLANALDEGREWGPGPPAE